MARFRWRCGQHVGCCLAWGESQGGRGGRPWGKTHVRNRITHLGWWQERLGLEILANLEGVLPCVEEALRELQVKGRAGKTLANYAEALAALCDWCRQRSYLASNPLKSFEKVAQTLLADNERATCVQRQSVEKSKQAAIPCESRALRPVTKNGGGGNRTRSHPSPSPTNLVIFPAESRHSTSPDSPLSQPPTKFRHKTDSNRQPACAEGVPTDSDLQKIIEAWPTLSAEVRTQLVAVVRRNAVRGENVQEERT